MATTTCLARFPFVAEPDPKTCIVCGRTMQWRKKWERSWDEVRHCSTACRRRGVTQVDRDLETAILELLSARARRSSICPSEAAKVVAIEDWRSMMEPARAAARRLAADGQVEITQRNRRVDPSTSGMDRWQWYGVYSRFSWSQMSYSSAASIAQDGPCQLDSIIAPTPIPSTRWCSG